MFSLNSSATIGLGYYHQDAVGDKDVKKDYGVAEDGVHVHEE